MVTLVLIGVFFTTLLLGVPVAFSVGVAALSAIFFTNVPMFVIFQRMLGGVNSFTLLAIPFFVFMGNIMDKGGIARRIVEFANILIGQIRGGLAAVNVLASMFFAGISGSAVADTSSIGAMLIPMMNSEGYDRNFSVAVTCTSSTIGLIIPPSNPMILYSFVAGGVSIAQLFAAGLVPGILVGLGLMTVGFVVSVRRGYPRHPRPSLAVIMKVVRETVLSLVIVVIIVGGILGGVFTATEAAVFGVVYCLLLTMLVYKELTLKDLPAVMIRTVYTTAIVIFLIATSTAFSYVMAVERVPQIISGALLSITENQYLLLLLINIMLLFVGMLMDMSPAILIFTPILLPIVSALGMSSVHFGIMMLVNLCIGLVTPPVGAVLFVGISLGQTTMARVVRPLMMFYGPMVLVLLLVTYFEPITMFVPRLLFDFAR